jgi:hypothetical protein
MDFKVLVVRINCRKKENAVPLQKFKTGTTVKVDDVMPEMMSHFEKGFIGVVSGTYGSEYGGGKKSFKSYTLFMTKGNKIVNQISWYDESQLTLHKEQKDWSEQIEAFMCKE